MACVALRYWRKWDKTLDDLADCIEENNDLRDSRDWHKYESERLLTSVGDLNIEVEVTKEKLQKSEFQCDLLNKEIADKNARLLKLLDENNKLRSQLPKRDSKGRYCKK
jgi:septal ring factor EnvC (AmiA/AmiB activator)